MPWQPLGSPNSSRAVGVNHPRARCLAFLGSRPRVQLRPSFTSWPERFAISFKAPWTSSSLQSLPPLPKALPLDTLLVMSSILTSPFGLCTMVPSGYDPRSETSPIPVTDALCRMMAPSAASSPLTSRPTSRGCPLRRMRSVNCEPCDTQA